MQAKKETASDFGKIAEGLLSLARKGWRHLSRYFWGASLSDNKEGKAGNEAVAGLLGIVFLSTGALIAAVQDIGRTRPEFVWFYMLAAAIPLVAMTAFLRARNRRARSDVHFFDIGTIRFTRSVLVMSFMMCVASTYLGLVGLLPGQPQRQIRYFSIHDVAVHRFSDKTRGLVASAKLDRSVYPEGIPPQIAIKIYRLDELETWFVSEVRLVGLSTDRRRNVYRTRYDDRSLYQYEVLWPRPSHDKQVRSYEIEIDLRPSADATEEDMASLQQQITEGKGLTVLDPRLE